MRNKVILGLLATLLCLPAARADAPSRTLTLGQHTYTVPLEAPARPAPRSSPLVRFFERTWCLGQATSLQCSLDAAPSQTERLKAALRRAGHELPSRAAR